MREVSSSANPVARLRLAKPQFLEWPINRIGARRLFIQQGWAAKICVVKSWLGTYLIGGFWAVYLLVTFSFSDRILSRGFSLPIMCISQPGYYQTSPLAIVCKPCTEIGKSIKDSNCNAADSFETDSETKFWISAAILETNALRIGKSGNH